MLARSARGMSPKPTATRYNLLSVVDNRREFAATTLAAQGLNIADVVGTAFREGNHVIHFQAPIGRATTQTSVAVSRA
jgi:hypothetical protein